MDWGFWGAPCWGCPGGKARADVDMGWDSPRPLCAEVTLARQLKLKWCKPEGPGALPTEGTLAGQLRLKWVWPGAVTGLSVQRVPWQDS